MAHPNKKESESQHSAKLHKYTRDYGDANPSMKKLAPVDKQKQEGGEESVGYGADSSKASAKSDRPARRSKPANPLATYKKGGRVKHRDSGGTVRDPSNTTGANANGDLLANEAAKAYYGAGSSLADREALAAALKSQRARGGRVKHRDSGGDVSAIEEANKNQAMANPNRARGGRTKHKGTHVNVIVAPQGGGGAGLPPPVVPPMGANPALAGGPPMPPPGMPAGGPPMPPRPMMGPPPGPMMAGAPGGLPPGLGMPRKKGGRVKHRDMGGAAQVLGGVPLNQLRATMLAQDPGGLYGGGPQKTLAQTNPSYADSKLQEYQSMRKRGGKTHSDAKEDKAMIKSMVKGEALKHRAAGGRIKQPHMTAGAATGEGRLEKIGKKAHDAGKPQTV